MRPVVPEYLVGARGVTQWVLLWVGAAWGAAGVDDWRRHVTVDQSLVRPADAGVQVGDARRAREVLGWSPTVSFDEIVARMVQHDVKIAGGAP